ncbi:hypothetical protein D3C81_2194770 [compost metagenome]
MKKAQSDLGAWHDRLQWLLQVREDADLAVCKTDWQQQLQEAAGKSDVMLDALQVALKQR